MHPTAHYLSITLVEQASTDESAQNRRCTKAVDEGDRTYVGLSATTGAEFAHAALHLLQQDNGEMLSPQGRTVSH
jgi:hypothetical protein